MKRKAPFGEHVGTYETYDDAGRLLTETQDLTGQPQALTVSYTPDADGRPSTLGYPSGLEVAYAYGARGLLSTISAGGSTLATIARDSNGRRSSMSLVNGTSTAYSFDAASRITGIDHATIGGPFATRDYIYNSLDLPTNMVSGISGIGNVTDDYSHDPLDQLVRARYDLSGGTPVRDVQYSFDAVGNRTAVDDTGTNVSYTVNNLNQYTAIGGDSLTYDGNGNLATGAGLTLGYDAQGRLISAATATNAVSFIYDGRNRCVARTTVRATSGSTVWFVWGHEQSSHWGLLEERDADGDLVARYVHGEGIDEVLRREAGASTVFYHHDVLGSTIALTDGSGALVEQYRYDVYGLPTVLDASGAPSTPDPRTSPLGNRFMFTGREWLADLALYDYRHRVYSPTLGRWLQPDPIGFSAGDVNLYRYCSNSASALIDPSGLMWNYKAIQQKELDRAMESVLDNDELCPNEKIRKLKGIRKKYKNLKGAWDDVTKAIEDIERRRRNDLQAIGVQAVDLMGKVPVLAPGARGLESTPHFDRVKREAGSSRRTEAGGELPKLRDLGDVSDAPRERRSDGESPKLRDLDAEESR